MAATLSVNGTYNTIEAKVSGSTLTTTNGGNVNILASDNTTINALVGAVAISADSSAVGASFASNYIANNITAKVENSTITSSGDVKVDAEESSAIHSLSIGGAGGEEFAVAGSLSANVITTNVTGAITGGASSVSAKNNLRVIANNTANIVAIAGALAIGGKAGVGLSVTNVTILNTTKAYTWRGGGVRRRNVRLFTDVLGTHQGLSIEANSEELS